MEATQKNAISHRAHALQKLHAYLQIRMEGEVDHDSVPL
jgi:inosine/xanthosine triphosphate pyrophosphatase family protein